MEDDQRSTYSSSCESSDGDIDGRKPNRKVRDQKQLDFSVQE